jgi:Dolichyl-phosphate-mannose-protein mannosyltransferase
VCAFVLVSVPCLRRMKARFGTLENWMERHAMLLLTLLTAVYTAGTVASAAHRQFWFDEFFTVDLARLPDLQSHIQALHAGADLTPALFHIATRVASHLAGTGRVGMRLPAIFGFWVMCLCLYLFVRRRFGVTCGIGAMLIPLFTGVEHYATEARGQGLMLGFCGLAVLCWQNAGERTRWRALHTLGVSVFLVASIYSHLHAVFLLIPLAVGEAVREMENRKIDFAMWMALIVGTASVFLTTAVTRQGAQTGQWTKDIYRFLLDGSAFPLVILAAALLIFVRFSLPHHPTAPPLVLPRSELAMIVVAAFLIPLLVSISGAPGHMLISIIGLALAGGSMLGELSRRYRGAAALATLVLLGFFANLEMKRLSPYAWRESDPVFRIPAGLPQDLPVYVQEASLYIELAHSVPSGPSPRFVSDPPFALQTRGDNIADKDVLRLKGWGPVRIETYADVQNGPRNVLLVYSDGPSGWLLQKLREDGAQTEVLAQQGEWLWMKVHQGDRRGA